VRGDPRRGRVPRHGMSQSSEYLAYTNMKRRCYEPGHSSYPQYGAIGTRVCARWLECFDNFFEDMGRKPSPDHSLDRIDSTKDYGPKNCRWATLMVQQHNRSNVKKPEVVAALLRDRAETGASRLTLANRYDVCPSTVTNWLRGSRSHELVSTAGHTPAVCAIM
jgi:hypothetical protein